MYIPKLVTRANSSLAVIIFFYHDAHVPGQNLPITSSYLLCDKASFPGDRHEAEASRTLTGFGVVRRNIKTNT